MLLLKASASRGLHQNEELGFGACGVCASSPDADGGRVPLPKPVFIFNVRSCAYRRASYPNIWSSRCLLTFETPFGERWLRGDPGYLLRCEDVLIPERFRV